MKFENISRWLSVSTRIIVFLTYVIKLMKLIYN